jgi:site-specific DNA-methyltransferase (adenine-specific)/modification methylase
MAAAQAKTERVVQVDPRNLTAHPKNQLIYDDEPDTLLLQAIEQQGVVEPLVVDKKTNQVISGRRRHKAALKLKLDRVPVIYRTYGDDLSAIEAIIHHNQYRQKTDRQIMLEVEALAQVEGERAKRRQVAGSRKGGLAGKGVPKNKGESDPKGDLLDLSPLPTSTPTVRVRKKRERKSPPQTTSGIVAEKIGRSQSTVEKAMAVINDAKATHGKDWTKAPEVKAVLQGKATIGRAANKVKQRREEEKLADKAQKVGKIAIDLREQDHIRDIVDESIDHVITDPPYGVATGFAAQFKDRKNMSSDFCGWDVGELHLDEIDAWVSEWARVMKTGGNIAVFCADKYLSFVIAALKKYGFESILTVVWHKTNPEPSVRKSGFVSSCEYAVTACKGQKRRSLNWHGQNEMHNHIEAPVCAGKERLDHPTQKPERVITWLIERLTSPGDRVLDNFAGVGTTGIVCRDLKRYFVLVEKEKHYCDLIRARFTA